MADLTKQEVNYWVDIHSIHRINKNEPYGNLTFKIDDLININSQSPVFLSVPHVHLSPTIYNISDYTGNNYITVRETDETIPETREFNIILDDGNYNLNNFIPIFQQKLNFSSGALGFGWTYTITYDSLTGKMYIENNSQDVLQKITIKMPDNKRLNYLQFLGVSKHSQILNSTWTNNNYFWISPDVVDFTNITSIYLRGNLWRNQTYETLEDSKGRASNIMQVIPVTGNGFSVSGIHMENISTQKLRVDKPFKSYIKMFLTTDDENFRVDIRGDWSLSLLVNYDEEY